MTEAEEWRPVPGWEGLYDVSDHGRVRSLPRKYVPGRILRAPVAKNGYPMVVLKHRERCRYAPVHRLVAEAFIGPLPTRHQTRHLDGNPLNNNLSNLTYGTVSENSYDAVRHGRNRNAAKTHCKRGHSLADPANLRATKRYRECRPCSNARRRELRASR
jgi:hypothetical protein